MKSPVKQSVSALKDPSPGVKGTTVKTETKSNIKMPPYRSKTTFDAVDSMFVQQCEINATTDTRGIFPLFSLDLPQYRFETTSANFFSFSLSLSTYLSFPIVHQAILKTFASIQCYIQIQISTFEVARLTQIQIVQIILQKCS